MTRRPVAIRRGGPGEATLGYLSVGASALVLLASGPRLLDHAAFGKLALTWTVANVFGLGLAFPTEQLISRRHNARLGSTVPRAVAGLAALGIAFVGGALFLRSHNGGLLVVAVAIAVAGWTAAALIRGRIAGAGDLRLYGAVLHIESGTRLLLVILASLGVGSASIVLALAVGVPLFVSAAAGALVRVGAVSASPSVSPGEHLGFVAVALGYQACLNGPAIVLGFHAGLPTATVGAYVVASTYFRAPTILVSGIITSTLVSLSDAYGRGDLIAFRQTGRDAQRLLLLVAIGSTVALGALSQVVLPAYFGSALRVPVSVLLALAVSSVIAALAMLVTQSLLAAGRSSAAAAAWVGAALVTIAVFAATSSLGWGAAGGLVLAPLASLLIAWPQASRSALSRPGRPPS